MLRHSLSVVKSCAGPEGYVGQVRAEQCRAGQLHNVSTSIRHQTDSDFKIVNTWIKVPRTPQGKRWLCVFCKCECLNPESTCINCRRDNYGLLNEHTKPDEIIDRLTHKKPVWYHGSFLCLPCAPLRCWPGSAAKTGFTGSLPTVQVYC